MAKQDRSEQFRSELLKKQVEQSEQQEGQEAMAGLAFEPFSIKSEDLSPAEMQELEREVQKPGRIIDLTATRPPEEHIHEEGEPCGEYFIKLLSEEDHILFIQGLKDEGLSGASIILALLKACLEQKDVRRTARFFGDESFDAVRASTGKPNLKECPICHEQFKPRRGGQMYCCNTCGAIASGVPVEVSEHDENCPTQEAA